MPRASDGRSAKDDRPKAIESDVYVSIRAFEALSLLLAISAFLLGAIVVLAFFPGARLPMSDVWRVVLIGAGTMCAGFGMAAILYTHLRARQATALRAEYAALHARADSLVAKFDAYARSKSAP